MTSPIHVKEIIAVKGITIKPDMNIIVPLLLLHKNPKVWQEPDNFIPERFDPESPYYLTPDGKKRNPTSFLPFFGGRRICLGKTFAENIAKIIVPILISEIDFKFKKEIHYEKKPPKSISLEINVPLILS